MKKVAAVLSLPIATLLFATLTSKSLRQRQAPQAAPPQPMPPRLAGTLALTHVAVIDCSGAKPRADQTVIITAGRITALGRTEAVAIPPGTRVVDATGKFLIPGLWDMHTHVLINREWGSGTFLPLCVANGVTGIRDMGSGVPLRQLLRWRAEIATGKILGPPRIVLCGPMIDGPKPFWPNVATVVSNEAEGRRVVRRLKQEGADFVKVYSKVPRNAYFAMADECAKLGIPLAGHVPDSISAAEASDAGQRSMEHLLRLRQSTLTRGLATTEPDPDPSTTRRLDKALLGIIRGKPDQSLFTPKTGAFLSSASGRAVLRKAASSPPLVAFTFLKRLATKKGEIRQYEAVFEGNTVLIFSFTLTPEGKIASFASSPAPAVYSDKRAAAFFAHLQKNRTWQCPTLVALRARAYPDSGNPVDRKAWRTYMPPSLSKASMRDIRLYQDLTAEARAEFKKDFPREAALVARMRDTGVEFLAGTDAPLPNCVPGFSLHEELALLVEAGLTPLEALQSATINPARFLGLEKTLGTVQQGKQADLVLLNANPLVDIRNTRKINSVLVDGRLLDRATLDAILARLEAATKG